MRSIRKIKTSADQRYRRHLRVRKKIAGTPERPRLVVFRSSKHIYAQLVDDAGGLTIAGAADTSEGVQVEGKGKVARSFAVGKLIAAKAKEKGIAKVVFDRGGYQYRAEKRDGHRNAGTRRSGGSAGSAGSARGGASNRRASSVTRPARTGRRSRRPR